MWFFCTHCAASLCKKESFSQRISAEKNSVVLILGDSLQLFTITFTTDSMHEPKACKKNSETTFAFNEDEWQFGDFKKNNILISQKSEEISATNAFFFLYKMAFWGCFMPLKMSVKHTWRVEREILSECIKVRYNCAVAFYIPSKQRAEQWRTKARIGRAFFPHVLLKLFRRQVEQILF